MSEREWRDVDRYLTERLVPADEALEAALAANAAAGLPPHDVTPVQGKLLMLLARIAGARRVLEIGTLGGYSTIWLARALPDDGAIVSLELDPARAAVARENLARAGLAHRVEVRVGPAQESLRALAEAGGAPFDLVFVDADKEGSLAYLEWSLRLTRPGSVLVFDNVVRGGAIADPADGDPRVQGVRALLDALSDEPRLAATAIQTVGAKGWDGVVLAVVTDAPQPDAREVRRGRS